MVTLGYIVCGIVGYLNLNNQPLAAEQPALQRMCESIRHRGPDEQGARIIGPVALGMTRLSIIDLATGQQPISNETDELWTVFNGEIYNYQELRQSLLVKGHTFRTQSDTEVIVHLYEAYGIDGLKHMEGMFAFAIFDKRTDTLILARDRMGEKPLHWTIVGDQLVFSSEIKGILAHGQYKRELNVHALRQYLSLEYVPAPLSIFKGIHKLCPAQFMIVKDGQVKIQTYWEPAVEPVKISEEDAAKELLVRLERSTKLRLISEVPLGVFLSGGVDSSSIAALAARNVTGKLKTFSIAFADASFDESDYAFQVAKRLGTEHEVATFEPQLALQTFSELSDYLDEPMADASVLPTFFLSKMTKRQVTVALSGEGGDELFGGYPTYQAHKMAQIWNTLPAAITQNLIEPLIHRLPVSMNNLSADYKMKRFASAARHPTILRHLHWMGSIPMYKHDKVLHKSILDSHEYDSTLAEDHIFSNLSSLMYGSENGDRIGSDLIDTVLRLDMTTYLPNDLLVKSDRASMAASLEARLPFLAFPVVEFALSLPSHLKLNGMTTKYILKKAVADLLPDNIINRPKKGFGIPVAKWLRKEFLPVVDECLNASFIRKQGIFNFETIEQMLREHNDRRADHRKELWTLLMFQCWWVKFMQPATLSFTGSSCERDS